MRKDDLNLILENALLSLKASSLPRSLTLRFVPAPNAILDCPCEAEEIVKTMSLLVRYSISRLTKDGDAIEVRVESDLDKITILVSDSGEGLRADSGLFDLFHRSGLRPLRNPSEIDESLRLAHEVSKTTGSKIWVESKWGAGTTFHFEIPLKLNQSILKKG